MACRASALALILAFLRKPCSFILALCRACAASGEESGQERCARCLAAVQGATMTVRGAVGTPSVKIALPADRGYTALLLSAARIGAASKGCISAPPSVPPHTRVLRITRVWARGTAQVKLGDNGVVGAGAFLKYCGKRKKQKLKSGVAFWVATCG